jgi:hypothetical protein
MTSAAVTGTIADKKIVLVLALTSDNVTGAETTSMIPIPLTSPVLIGELP